MRDCRLRLAHLRKHQRSPFWYLRRRNLDTNVWEEESTGLRHSSDIETRKAQRLADKASSDEQRIGASGKGSQAFAAWVPLYLASHWQGLGDSRRRYTGAWQALRSFLASSDIVYPRQIKYSHGASYIAWRIATPVHGKHVRHNTALLELKFLSQLMNEAVRREFAESNPLLRLGIARNPQKIKPEFTNKHIEKLRKAFANQPEWMSVCSEISLYTGCRFSESAIPLTDVDLRSGSLRLRDSKRKETDPRKYFTVPIHDSLKPLFRRLKREGADITCSLTSDKNGRINYIIKSTLGPAFSFHCYRVTFVTRCHRGGLSEAEAMRLVNHSSSLVHRIYSRLNVEDVRKAQRKIPLP